jgi:hypothetical protein
MLGDAYACTCGDERGSGRDIKRARCVAAGPAGVDQQFIGAGCVAKNWCGMVAHGTREADQLFNGLALGAQRGKQRDDRVFPSAPGKDFLHRAFGLVPRKICSGFRFFSENLHHEDTTPAS